MRANTDPSAKKSAPIFLTCRRVSVQLTFFFVAGLFAACGAHAGKATVDLSGLDEDTRALVAKERARAMTTQSDGEKKLKAADKTTSRSIAADDKAPPSNGSALLDNRRSTVIKGGVTGGCDINIGNTDSKHGTGSTKPKPVIITGPVVQLCNK